MKSRKLNYIQLHVQLAPPEGATTPEGRREAAGLVHRQCLEFNKGGARKKTDCRLNYADSGTCGHQSNTFGLQAVSWQHSSNENGEMFGNKCASLPALFLSVNVPFKPSAAEWMADDLKKKKSLPLNSL